MAILFKGAAPGTHWWTNNARLSGLSAALLAGPTASSAVRHITSYSNPSAFVSLTASFAVARSYALAGPGGVATAAAPGYVYEIDTSVATVATPLHDPVQLIASALGTVGLGPLLSHHDGEPDLIHGIASPASHGAALTRIPARSPGTHLARPAAVSN